MKTNTILDKISGEIKKRFNGRREVMDPNPIATPLKFKREPSYFEQIRDSVRRELSKAANDRDMDTFEEANDFEIGEDFVPYSPHEERFGPDGISDFERGRFTEPDQGGDPQDQEGDIPPAKPSKDKKTSQDPDTDLA